MILAGLWVLAGVYIWQALRRSKREFSLLVMAFLFAWSVEAFLVCADSFSYQFAFLFLPGGLPVYILLAWALIFFQSK